MANAAAQAVQALDSGFTPDLADGAARHGQEEGRGEARQFVIFHVETEMFAVSLDDVQEIIRIPEVVRVPFSPASLLGLANLRGTVLPVLNLRDVFAFPPVLNDDATRVVVLDQGNPIGLVVDRMANVVTVDPERIEPTSAIEGSVDTALLTGMIKGDDGQSMVMILDAAQLVSREFSQITTKARTSAGHAPAADRDSAARIEAEADEDQLVSFEVAGQEYAFPIERVQEIVQLPERLTHVPNAPAHVLGVITLRNRLLPLVSLREMFGLQAKAFTETNKVVVVSLGEGGNLSVGVVMDSVKEVLRVSRNLVEAMPTLLSQDGGMDEIQAICRLQDGRRLVSVLSVEKMFDTNELRKLAATENEAMSADGRQDGDARQDAADEEQFVVFRLMGEEYGVPIEAVQEIVRVPEELTRIPKAPSFVEGVINLRGVVLPVVDQRRRFNLAEAERNDRQRIMVFTVRGVRTGFIVDSVSEVMRISAKAIGDAPNLSDAQQRLIRRVANLESQKRMVLLLDTMQLLDTQEAAAVRLTTH
ncbi:chemotaxis protein CheW [Methylobacterium sp. J-030]|uniref:chemotaxis protein CheW n=1 Tax=Methylobacterium sp. J-030 TaxID=2836627 RepID=UPI001FB9566C|nr:chemotaxis protein CheW [Methylobacterium sp. J-030]MCJ2069364.1 chemotaxis protein CheW [Methylobacterium sp. J-030]